MKKKAIVIVGAGGHGRVCAELAEASGWNIAGFIAARRNDTERIAGHAIIGACLNDLSALGEQVPPAVCLAVGDNKVRSEILKEALAHGFELPALLHPSAFVSKSSRIGKGTVVLPGAVVGTAAVVGDACILNTGCTIDHDNILAEGAQVCPGAHCAGRVHLGRWSFIGTGASIIPGVSIGEFAIVGAGAVVVRDVPPHTTVLGVPAKVKP